MTQAQTPFRCAFSTHGPPANAAPTIVFGHSLGSDSRMWHPQVLALKQRFHLVTLEFRGHGRSTCPPGHYTLDELRDDVLAVADHLGLARFHYCGISLGGIVGLSLALHAPSRLITLTAANTAARIGSEQSWQERREAVRRLGMSGLCQLVVPRWFGPRFLAEESAEYREIEQAFCQTDPDGYSACCAALETADLRAEVAHITTPTAIVAGELDVSTPPEQAQSLHRAIANSALTVLPGAAHLSNLDCPTLFTESLARFVGARMD